MWAMTNVLLMPVVLILIVYWILTNPAKPLPEAETCHSGNTEIVYAQRLKKIEIIVRKTCTVIINE